MDSSPLVLLGESTALGDSGSSEARDVNEVVLTLLLSSCYSNSILKCGYTYMYRGVDDRTYWEIWIQENLPSWRRNINGACGSSGKFYHPLLCGEYKLLSIIIMVCVLKLLVARSIAFTIRVGTLEAFCARLTYTNNNTSTVILVRRNYADKLNLEGSLEDDLSLQLLW